MRFQISRKAGVNSTEKIKSYTYHYTDNTCSTAGLGRPAPSAINQILTFGVVGDSVNLKNNLSWTAEGSDIKYFEVYRFTGTNDGEYVRSALIDHTTMTDKYISYNIPYKYGIIGILNDGKTTAWKFTETKILTNGCRGNGKISRSWAIKGTFETLDEACDEITLEEGFETDNTGSYEARIKN
ncbi:hypothetical protein [Emticicia sp. 17c]|uniref:hypothetical protein n=1 Tax=Emticicia sp. 17c TaxID=3127704 RepID=UPI00301C1C21